MREPHLPPRMIADSLPGNAAAAPTPTPAPSINDIAAKVCELVIASRRPEDAQSSIVTRIHTPSGVVYSLLGSEPKRFKRMLREAANRAWEERPRNRHERRKREAQDR